MDKNGNKTLPADSPGASRYQVAQIPGTVVLLHQGAWYFLAKKRVRGSPGEIRNCLPPEQSGGRSQQGRAEAGSCSSCSTEENREAQRRWETCTGSHSTKAQELDSGKEVQAFPRRSSPGPVDRSPAPGTETGDSRGPQSTVWVIGQNKQFPCGTMELGELESPPPASPGPPGTGGLTYLKKGLPVCQNASHEATGGK